MKKNKTKKNIIVFATIFVIVAIVSLTTLSGLYSPFSPIPALAELSTREMFEKHRADYTTEEAVGTRIIKYYKTINGIKTGDWYQVRYDNAENIINISHSGCFIKNQKVLPIIFEEFEPQARIVRSVYDLGEYEHELIESKKEVYYGVDTNVLIPIECRKNTYRTLEKIFIGYYVEISIDEAGTAGFSAGKIVQEPIGEPWYNQPYYYEDVVINLNDGSVIYKDGFYFDCIGPLE